MTKYAVVILILIFTLFIILAACSDNSETDGSEAEATGSLVFKANGEDFVRQGFVSKDGWEIAFNHVYITLSDITAYQTNPPYDAHTGGPINSKVQAKLSGIFTVDLAEGDETAGPIFVGILDNAIAGHYNTIFWNMNRADSGPSSGYSLLMMGTARKNGQKEDFFIGLNTICEYSCGEFVGDERKGIVSAGSTSDLEMTFHFDHLFGDGDLPAEDELNHGALGFEALLAMPNGGDPDMDMADLHLGHVGEGHCYCECE